MHSTMRTTFILLFLAIHTPAIGQEEFEELFRRAEELSDQGLDVEALEAFRAAARLSPDNPYVHYNIGRLLQSYGLLSEAIVSYRRAAELAPEERPFQFALGESLYRAGRKAEETQKALELAVSPPEPMAEAILILAAIYESEQETDKALTTLARYLELRPDDVKARLLLGDHLTGARRTTEAIQVWKEGLDEKEPSPELLYRIGQNLSREPDKYPQAEIYLRQALDADPKHLDTQVLLGRVLTRQGKTEEGLELLARAADDHPDSPNVFYVLATLYQQLGKENEAREAGERFQRLTKGAEERDHRDARIKVAYRRGRELLEQGKMNEAEATFKTVLELDPHDANTHSVLAKIALSKGRLPEAKRWIEQALVYDDSVGEFHFLLGLVETRSGNLGAAEPATRRSVELMPGFPDGWVLLGSILADTSRAADAVDCYLRAGALEPSNPTIQLNLATAYHALGRLEEEEQAMARYRELTATENANQ